jgi:ribonuclease I
MAAKVPGHSGSFIAVHQKPFVFGLFAALSAVFTLAAPASAQLRWDDSGREGRQEHVAGKFDYYALVLSWSPTHCSTPQGEDDDMQCNRRDGKKYSFVLHGLWPQYTRGWPQDCRTPRRPFVPDAVINGMLDIMPSRGLIIHEYRKHGTCSGLDVQGYFTLSRQLFKAIRIPQSTPIRSRRSSWRRAICAERSPGPTLVCRSRPSQSHAHGATAADCVKFGFAFPKTGLRLRAGLTRTNASCARRQRWRCRRCARPNVRMTV